MNKKELETRFYIADLETREENGVGIVEGRPIVFDSIADLGAFSEIISRGALDNTDLRDVRLCLNHDTSYVYARSRNNNVNSTMRIMPDELGLRFIAQLDIKNSPKAQDYYSAIVRKDIDKMSFMFSVEADEWENLESEHPTRRITKIGKVVEVSAVTFPAYDSTEISARSKETLDSARLELESAREQRAKSVDTDNSLELAKAKYNYFFKNGG